MNENLSQRQIDRMFRGPESSGEVDITVHVLPYDFMRPAWFSKERRAALENIYSRFAASLQSFLAPRVRVPLEISISSVEQAVFSEFVQSLETPCAAFVFLVGDRLGGRGVLAIGPDLACHLLERLLGGSGRPGETGRGLSPIEQTVLSGVMGTALDLLRDASKERFRIQPRLESYESDPAMVQIVSRDDSVLVANLDVKFGNVAGNLTLCLSTAVCEAALVGSASRRAFQPGPAEPESLALRTAIGQTLRHAHVTVRARLPMVRVSAREIAALRPGSVLTTPHLADEPIQTQINDRPRFSATLGQVRRRVSLKILEPLKDADMPPSGRDKEGRVL
ncbi:MAG: flagellar motor switch protein FliM [Candidatus Eiseniibacteriota bacterium]